jgi:hypothetical protein
MRIFVFLAVILVSTASMSQDEQRKDDKSESTIKLKQIESSLTLRQIKEEESALAENNPDQLKSVSQGELEAFRKLDVSEQVKFLAELKVQGYPQFEIARIRAIAIDDLPKGCKVNPITSYLKAQELRSADPIVSFVLLIAMLALAFSFLPWAISKLKEPTHEKDE